MDPLSLVPQHIRALVKRKASPESTSTPSFEKSTPPSLPWSQAEEFALVAIIDISGYSKLSSYLNEVLGSDSGAKVKELLNKPINAIIKHVHLSGGSIVKFAGDAVIASWSVQSIDTKHREIVVRRVFASCLQLMNFFKGYELVIPDKGPKVSTPDTVRKSPSEPLAKRFSLDIEKRRSSMMADNFEKQTKKQPLKIHIGLGIGEMQHVHIGNQVKGSKDGAFSRSEYFIAGKALKNSGILLGLGKPGDFTFDSIGHDLVIGAMTSEPSFPPVRKGSRDLGGRYFMVTETDPIEKYLLCLTQDLGQNINVSEVSESALFSLKDREPGFINTIVPYIDDALAQSVRKIQLPLYSSEDLDGESPYNVDLSSYDQLRGVAILFLYFPAFNVDTVAQPENLVKLQSVTMVILEAVRNHQGCIRQFNCDDKSLTALLVWGLEGFAHEKSECYFSMAAAVEMIPKLKAIIADEFSIGATAGTVFAGIIGNQSRCDGTLLGVCVNNAARLMCLEQCKGGVLCDEGTYNDTRDAIDYNTDLPEVCLKGVEYPVKIFTPLARSKTDAVGLESTTTLMIGREKEVAVVSDLISSWLKEERCRLIIAGRSGTGKSVLLKEIETKVNQVTYTISSVSKCQENHQNTLLSAFTQITTNLISSIKTKQIKVADIHKSMQVDGSLSRPSVFESKGRLFKRLSKASGTDIQIQGSNENFGLVPAADAANFPGLNSIGTKIPITHQGSIKAQDNQRKSSPKTELASNTDSFDSEKLGASLNPNSISRGKSQEIRLNEFNLTKTVDRSSSTSGPQTFKAGKKAKGQTESITEAYNNRPSISVAASMSKLGSNIMVSASPLLAATSLEFIRKVERADSEGSSTSDVLCALFSGPECDTLNAIPGLNTTQNVQSVTQDILARLASLYSKLFGALAYLGYKVAIIFDDLQWCDSFSLELLSNLMQKCPAVLFVCVKRPLEEWKDSRTHIMRNIKKVHSTKRIELDSLDKPSVEAMIKHIVKFQLTSIASSLTDEIFNRSQGNPLVADVLIRVLNDDPNIAVIDGVLKRTGGNAASLPSGATAAVVAQFDKLKPAMKQILKYASISGMEFNIQELNDIIMKTDEPALYDLTPSGIADTIAMYDVYRFVKETENKDVFCFSHFMIQQGILSTMVPSKREEIHAVYADYFLKKIKRGSNKWEAIQSVIQHLFQVTGQEERKQITLYTAFLESAEMGMINEAFDFYEALQGFPKRLVLTKNAYEVIRERRLLAFIHLSKGDNTEAMKHCQEALNIAGYERSSNGFSILRRLVRMFEASKQVITCEDEQRRADISKVYAQKHFKMAFKKSHPGISDVRASVASRRASEGNKRDSIRFDLTQRTIDEIIQTILLMKQILAPSFELIELQGVALILGQSLFKEQELQVASYFVEFSCALQSIGLLKLSNQASLCCERILLEYNEAKGQNYVASESEDYAISSIHKNRGLLHWYQGSWSQAAEHFKTSQEILNSRGKGFLEAAYFARNVSAGLFSICGNLSQTKASIESDVKFHLSDDDKELSGEFQFRQAAAFAEANLVEDTERLYSQAIEIYTVNTEDSIRTLLCMTNAIRSALVILHNGLDHENVVSHQVERINNHFETCFESTLSVKPLQVSLLSRIWISQLILMMELHILTSGKLTARSEVSVTILNLMSEINKANTASLTKPLTEVSGFCKRLCGAVKALWSPVANVQAFSNETRKALKIGGTKPWLDSHLRRLLMSRILCVLTIHGSKEKHELPIDEYLFEQEGFLYEATLLRELRM